MAISYDAALYVADEVDIERTGPFETYEAAQEYVDECNMGLSLRGIPGGVASWSVIES